MRESQLRNRVRMMLLESPDRFDLGEYIDDKGFTEPFKGIITSRSEVQAEISRQIVALSRDNIDTSSIRKSLDEFGSGDLSDRELSRLACRCFALSISRLARYKSGFTPITRDDGSIIVDKVYNSKDAYVSFFKDMAAEVKPGSVQVLGGFFDSAFRGRDVRTLPGGQSAGASSAAGSPATASSAPTPSGLAQRIDAMNPAPGQGAMAPLTDAVTEVAAAQNVTSANATRLVSLGNSILEGADYGVDTIRSLLQPTVGGDFQIEKGAVLTGGDSFYDNFCKSIYDAYFSLTPTPETVGNGDNEKRVRQVVAAIRYASVVNEGNEKEVMISAGIAMTLSALGYAGVKSSTPAREGGGRKPDEGFWKSRTRILKEKYKAANMVIDIAGEKYPKSKEVIEAAAKEIEASVEKDQKIFDDYSKTVESIAADIAEIEIQDRRLTGLSKTLADANIAQAEALRTYQGIPRGSTPEAKPTSGEFKSGLEPSPEPAPESSEFDVSASTGGDVSSPSSSRAGSRQQVAAAQARRLDAQADKTKSEERKIDVETAGSAAKQLADANAAVEAANVALAEHIIAMTKVSEKIATSTVVRQSPEPLDGPGAERDLYLNDLRTRLAETQKNAEGIRAKLEETKKFLSDPAADKSAKAWDYAKDNNSLPPSMQSFIPLVGGMQYLYYALAAGSVLGVSYLVVDVLISNLSSSEDPANITQSILTQDDATIFEQNKHYIPGASGTTDLYQEMTSILDDRRGAMWIVGIFRSTNRSITKIEAEEMYGDITNMVKAAESREPLPVTVERGVVACAKVIDKIKHRSAAPVMPAQSTPAQGQPVRGRITPRLD